MRAIKEGSLVLYRIYGGLWDVGVVMRGPGCQCCVNVWSVVKRRMMKDLDEESFHETAVVLGEKRGWAFPHGLRDDLSDIIKDVEDFNRMVYEESRLNDKRRRLEGAIDVHAKRANSGYPAEEE